VLKLPAHRLERPTGQKHHMELIEDDLGMRKVFRRALDMG
jgi:hypothetical protein